MWSTSGKLQVCASTSAKKTTECETQIYEVDPIEGGPDYKTQTTGVPNATTSRLGS